MKGKMFFAAGAVFAFVCFVHGGSVVKVTGGEGKYKLIRNGEEYFIKGAGGGGSKELLAGMGGNSFRTWGAGEAESELNTAQRYGLTVALGFWLGHQPHGFDYTDQAALDRQTRSVLEVVRAFKGHPALLMWALGNEMEVGNSHEIEMWKYINELARKVKEIDPDHPVMTVIAEIPDAKVKNIHTYCPDVDIVGINTYGGAGSIPERWRKAGGTKPYVVTEFGPPGTWEGRRNSFGCPMEKTSTEKADWYADVYKKTVEGDRGGMCLGSYAFTWGWKVEATPTWYGLLLPDGSILGAARALQEAWGVTKPDNRSPRIGEIKVSTDRPSAGEVIHASVVGEDPDGDSLKWKWDLVQEATFYGVTGTGAPVPISFENAITEGQGSSSVKVVLPGGGKYRLYAYCFDGRGDAAYSNVPLEGSGPEPDVPAQRADMPCEVYTRDGKSPRWIASGYMGNVNALKMDLNWKGDDSADGVCIRVGYNAADGWAGVQWQHPANDWGEKPGGFDLSQARTLVFRARGEKGGEKITFFCGGEPDGRISPTRDTSRSEIKDIVLRPEWTRYRIPLDGRDLTRIKTGFGFSFGGSGAPFTFYLDDISYTAD